MCAPGLAEPEGLLAVHVSLDGVDYGSANDIHDEQDEREAKAHKDTEQDGTGWIGCPRLDAGCHGVDCIVKDRAPNIASKRLHGIEAERPRGERRDCLVSD